ncbi:PQQ-binding-like beta-propeller repeat protein (plasmid) [Deinococcus sp. KNUC1210]|uniref:pyrroloquinoline quinone-dependent dehydrogenase n=1 Tax=Deinococcus sp. KNUC1210 TaxID=2917691 RepID=UPI001EEF8F30|nr:PQQ-binding-like beta-propeller repeat protein [Deinococcus sp. KNUC1210]ULH13875.1 PQQ-binding-like beta-propeller repeat protein [Deinococcus sp. KNUC1210]
MRSKFLTLALALCAAALAQAHAPAFVPSTRTISTAASSSEPTDAQLADPESADWLATGHDLGSQRHSPLKQINTTNAAQLRKVCTLDLHLSTTFETSLVEMGGTLFFTTPSGTYAADAATCKLRWHSEYAYQDPIVYPAQRGVAIAQGRVMRGTPDGHVLAYDLRTGKLLWNAHLVDSTSGAFIPAAPVAYGGRLFVGTAGGDWAANGYVTALDLQTGKQLWRFNAIPQKGEFGADTWPNDLAREHGGGANWTSVSLDPKEGTLYVPLGNPQADLNGGNREGANLFSDSVVALDTQNGHLRWYVQQLAHDTHDWDTSAAPAVYQRGGHPYMTLGTKAAQLFIYDRTTHKLLSTTPIATRLNTGTPPVKANPQRTCPGMNGGVEWNGPSYHPGLDLIYINTVDFCAKYQLIPGKMIPGMFYFDGAATFDPPSKASGWTYAVRAADGSVAWKLHQKTPMLAGVTTTDGGLVLTGDMNGEVQAIDARTGKVLYRDQTHAAVLGGVITYQTGGRQYVAAAAGGTWTGPLPKPSGNRVAIYRLP